MKMSREKMIQSLECDYIWKTKR